MGDLFPLGSVLPPITSVVDRDDDDRNATRCRGLVGESEIDGGCESPIIAVCDDNV